MLLPAVVLGELLYGFRHGSRYERYARDMRAFLDNSYVVTRARRGDRYSRIAASLRAKGRRIPTNDLWIAAHAMETGADRVSAARHFEHVDGIAWIRLRGERRPTWKSYPEDGEREGGPRPTSPRPPTRPNVIHGGHLRAPESRWSQGVARCP